MINQLKMAAYIVAAVKENESMPWKDIVFLRDLVAPEKKNAGMWLRNALQIAIDKGAIVRTDSVYEEVYIEAET